MYPQRTTLRGIALPPGHGRRSQDTSSWAQFRLFGTVENLLNPRLREPRRWVFHVQRVLDFPDPQSLRAQRKDASMPHYIRRGALPLPPTVRAGVGAERGGIPPGRRGEPLPTHAAL